MSERRGLRAEAIVIRARDDAQGIARDMALRGEAFISVVPTGVPAAFVADPEPMRLCPPARPAYTLDALMSLRSGFGSPHRAPLPQYPRY